MTPPLHALAAALGVHTAYRDGLGTEVIVGDETLVRVCAALGAEIASPDDAESALAAWRATQAAELVPPVVVAWDGIVPPIAVQAHGSVDALLRLESGDAAPITMHDRTITASTTLPFGVHELLVAAGGRHATCRVIAAPTRAWRSERLTRAWGVGVQLAALRTARSRSVGDLRDLATLCEWIATQGGAVVTLLPLLPTFNAPDPEPSPYSPVSRLFWSELLLDLGPAHRAVGPVASLDVARADAEVRAALAGTGPSEAVLRDPELMRYAMFRGAQARHGRNWRAWPEPLRAGHLTPHDVDGDEVRFQLVAQERVREQLAMLHRGLDAHGVQLGLDLAVGVHPDGYDAWSRQGLFVAGMSVGAPPDAGFPSGQDWGFGPISPVHARRDGHRYLRESLAHQMALAGVLRIDHVMAWSRLYWIPHGMRLDQGTYVSQPSEELFAVLTLAAHRHRCTLIGENLGTVPPEIASALPRHAIAGMYVAQFAAMGDVPIPEPTDEEVAMVGTHDTPTLAGWMLGEDIDERVRCGLLAADDEPATRTARAEGVARLAEQLGVTADEAAALRDALLAWLGQSASPLVLTWLEDLWLESRGVNLPGTRASQRPNWQRPMAAPLDELLGRATEAIAPLRAARGEAT
ncbi:MAG TPA: 4-alpha-glucanotransferase [Gemmatimonadales bacterium]|nr:4-alpha-glucanotransferase [Gemmatimonadales bacterium]